MKPFFQRFEYAMCVMKVTWKNIRKHLEWVVFTVGLIALAAMSPDTDGTSFCLFDFFGFPYCPGEGLGHSISYTFRGDLSSAFEENIAGPIAVVVLTLRIMYLVNKNVILPNRFMEEQTDG